MYDLDFGVFMVKFMWTGNNIANMYVCACLSMCVCVCVCSLGIFYRLPAGNALWFCQNFFFFFFFFFLFFRRQGFRMITFDRQTGPLQNFNRSHVMVIGRSASFSTPRDPRVRAWGAPSTPKSPPPLRKIFFLFACVSEPQEHF